MTLLLCSAFVAFLSTLAVVLLREVRAEIWERSIERQQWDDEEREWVQHMHKVHKRWREERLLSDAAAVAETMNRELTVGDWRRFIRWPDP